MRRRLALAPLLLAPLLLAGAPAEPALAPDEAAIRAHVQFLASDALRGREAGTPDYLVAAEYVAARLAAAGLAPAGPDGRWFQPVPLVTAKAIAEPTMAVTLAGRTEPLVFGRDFTAYRAAPGPERVALTTAPVVFAGYGVVDRSQRLDDYRGLDVRGKVVALLSTGPVGLNSEVGAHLGNAVERARTAAARGAMGVIFVESARTVTPFAQGARGWDATAVTWAGPDGTPRDGGARALGLVSHAGAEKLFAGSGLRFADVLAANKAGAPVPTGPLAATVTVDQRYAVQRVTSPNVVGMIRGSDPRLRDEYVVLSAHLDHIGVTRPVNGDAINNGAMDNAIGIASMLEVARRFGATPPKRSILFVAVTAEEKGLIGSDYFATFPTVAKGAIVANVNLDMPILTYRFRDLIALGAGRSGVGPIVAAAVREAGYALVDDPQPDQARFVRTDHYSFVKQGIPAVSLTPGPGGEGAAAQDLFRRTHYHRPSDEIGLPIDWTAAARFVAVNHAVAAALANAPERPRWVRGDYFGTLYKGPMAR